MLSRISGKYTLKPNRKPVWVCEKCKYGLFYRVHLGDQNKTCCTQSICWIIAPVGKRAKKVFEICNSNGMDGTNKPLNDCDFSLLNIKGINRNNRYK